MPVNDINRPLYSVGALTDLYEARIREYRAGSKHQKYRKRERVRFVFVTQTVRDGHTECKKNEDLNKLKSNHLVSDRKKWFETMLSVEGPTGECRTSKTSLKIEAKTDDDHQVTDEHMTQSTSDRPDSPAVEMVGIPEEENVDDQPEDNPDIPQQGVQDHEMQDTSQYKRRYQSIDQKSIAEKFRKSIKESLVQEFRELSLDSMEDFEDINEQEEATVCKSIIRSWSQQNLDHLNEDDQTDPESENQEEAAVCQSIIRSWSQQNLDCLDEDDKTDPETENQEEAAVRQSIIRSWSQQNLDCHNEDDGARTGQETEIDIYINGIKEDYDGLASFGEGEESARSSGRFVKNEHRSSGGRRSIRMRKSKPADNTTYPEYSEPDVVIDYTKDQSAIRNSAASSSAYESGDEEPDLDIFGYTSFKDYSVEAYNPKYHDKYDNILFKISLCREMIEMPIIEKNICNLKPQNKVERNGQQSDDPIYENCVPLNGDADNVEYDLLNVTSVEDATCKMKKHIYENHMISNNDNVVGGAYLDKNLNNRIEIICDSNPEPERQASLEVPARINTQLSSPTPKQQHIIKELIDTENKYIDNMEYVILQYLKYFINHPKRRRELPGISVIFGNIEALYESSKKILADLINCDSSVDCIANIFLQSKELFELYSEYMRNKSQTQAVLENFRIPLTERQRELNDKKSCDSYLLTPVQRPGRYKLLLESLQKELTKSGEENKTLEAAIRFVDENIQQANTLLAIDSISGCPIDLRKCGSFLLKETFNIKRKYKSVIFLFEGIIVFTTEHKYKSDTYDYKNSINANDLALKTHNKSTSFIVRDFPKCKLVDDGPYSFEIETSSEHVCKKWVNEIGGILWNQLSHFRQLQEKQREAPKSNGIVVKREVKELKRKRSLDRTNSIFYVPTE